MPELTDESSDALGVKLGHRRLLQREIATERGLSAEQLRIPSRTHIVNDGNQGRADDQAADGRADDGRRTKRKYRRHPKPDDHAPQRPPSAYVIFSNQIRDELKSQNLSFTEIAKRVGEYWQTLAPEEKIPFEMSAGAAKEKYHTEMAAYKMTSSYRLYTQYLTEFKAKHAISPEEGKKPKLEHQESTASGVMSASLTSGRDGVNSSHGSPDERRRRAESSSSAGLHSTTSGLPSPGRVTTRPSTTRGGLASVLPLGNACPMAIPPSSPPLRRGFLAGPSFAHAPSHQGKGAERTLPSRSDQHVDLGSPYENRESPSSQISSSGPPIDQSTSRDRRSPFEERRQASRGAAPPLGYNTSDSSKSSMTSGRSSASTAGTSVLGPNSIEDGLKPQLPPLSAVNSTPACAASIADYALRPNQPSTSTDQNSTSQCSPQSPFSRSSGMKFESLQLPLPYNISLGQDPLPRPNNEGKLANIFDLQDIPRERNSLRNLTLVHHGDSRVHGQSGDNKGQPALGARPPVLPGIRQMSSLSMGRNEEPRPDHDRLAFLASVANSEFGARPSS